MAEFSNGNNGKRSLVANINLVPYIDLMSTIIAFLMISSAFVQISSLDIVNESLSGEKESQNEKDLEIIVTKNLISHEKDSINIEQIDNDLALWIERIITNEKLGNRPHLRIFSADEINYKTLAKIIDASRPKVKTISLGMLAKN